MDMTKEYFMLRLSIVEKLEKNKDNLKTISLLKQIIKKLETIEKSKYKMPMYKD